MKAPGNDRRLSRIGCVAALTVLAGSQSAAAQGWRGSATTGAGSQQDCRPSSDAELREYHIEFSGSVLHTIGTARLAAGAQGDLCTSNGYPGGRGGPIAEFRVLSRPGRLQPFAKAGYFVADGGGQVMVGGGVDVFRAGVVGLRVSAQDAFRQVQYAGFDCAQMGYSPIACSQVGGGFARSFVGHELSFHAGITWK